MHRESQTISQVRVFDNTIGKALGACAFALLTIAGAHIQIRIPFTPVPMTLQTLFVPLAGVMLGAYWGSASMLLYLALGIFGFDAFASASGGSAFVFAPTAGYLIGFVVASPLAGWISKRPGKAMLLLSLAIAHFAIYAFGVMGLMLNAHYSLITALQKGVMPFLVGDILKLVTSFFLVLSVRTFRK